jgi:hypothetical protein
MLVEDDWDDSIIEEETNDVKSLLGCLAVIMCLITGVMVGLFVFSAIVWEIVEFVKGYK